MCDQNNPFLVVDHVGIRKTRLVPEKTAQPLVICYARYSTPEQSLGDSERRQVELANAWAAKKKLKVDESLRFWDRGVSGYHGKNETEGQLGKLIELAQSGKIPKGSYLLVENLDRLSRQDPLLSIGLLNRLMAYGLRVVTLTDGAEYNREQRGLDALMSLFRAGMDFYRGYGESDRKSGTITESWKGKRERAASESERMTSWCPAWMRPGDEGGFVLIPGRARIVRRIFTEFVGGRGVFAIAEGLRRDGIEPWGKIKSKARASAGGIVVWHKSYIHKILTNPAVIGRNQPYRVDKSAPGNRVPEGPPIEGYYPAAISAELWQAAERRWKAIAKNQKSASGPRGNNSITSLFSGLLQCERTGGAVVVQRKAKTGPQSEPRLYCVQAPGRYLGWRYDDFERDVLGIILNTDAAHIWPATQAADERRDLTERLAEVQESFSAKSKAIESLLDSLEGNDATGSIATIRERIELRSREREALHAEIQSIRSRLDLLNDEASRVADAVAAVRNLFGARSQPEMRDALRSHVRELVERITVHFPRIPYGREFAVMELAQKARKLLKLAQARRAKRGLTMDGFTFRNAKDAIRLPKALRIVARMRKRRGAWATITFRSGVTITTRGRPPGLQLAEDAGVFMAEGNADQITGYLGLFVPKDRSFSPAFVPQTSIDLTPNPEAVAEMERFFGKNTPSEEPEKPMFKVIRPKKKQRFPGT